MSYHDQSCKLEGRVKLPNRDPKARNDGTRRKNVTRRRVKFRGRRTQIEIPSWDADGNFCSGCGILQL